MVGSLSKRKCEQPEWLHLISEGRPLGIENQGHPKSRDAKSASAKSQAGDSQGQAPGWTRSTAVLQIHGLLSSTACREHPLESLLSSTACREHRLESRSNLTTPSLWRMVPLPKKKNLNGNRHSRDEKILNTQNPRQELYRKKTLTILKERCPSSPGPSPGPTTVFG